MKEKKTACNNEKQFGPELLGDEADVDVNSVWSFELILTTMFSVVKAY